MPTWEAEVRAPRARRAVQADFIVTNPSHEEAQRIFSFILQVPQTYVRMRLVGRARRRRAA